MGANDMACDREPSDLAAATVAPFRAAVSDLGMTLDAAQSSVVEALANGCRPGFYLWGGVGRGKSVLARTYVRSVPTDHKREFHFHDFFRDLQGQIMLRPQPLAQSVRALLGSARVVLFDEFHVHDVADAVYLSATLEVLVDDGVLVVATSNYAPEQLLPDPLHHHRFEDSIETIRRNLDVLPVGDGVDYRQGSASRHGGFAAGSWTVAAPGPLPSPPLSVSVAGHAIAACATNDNSVVFDFAHLCERPLGVLQYLSLAERFRSLSVIGVPDLGTVGRDASARFASLVEVLYERDVELHVVAGSDPGRLLRAAEPPRDVMRIVSRLALLPRRR